MDPGIEGLETCRRIIRIRPGQKAILVSGFSESAPSKPFNGLVPGNTFENPAPLRRWLKP